jgi:hypothetical protein
MKTIIIILTLLIQVAILNSQTPVKYEFRNKSEDGQNELRAIVNNKKYSLIRKSDALCIKKEKIADFDNDGYEDVLISIDQGCGAASCCGAEYQLFSFNGLEFVKSPVVGNDWNGIKISKAANKYLFEIDDTREGAGNYEFCNNSVETYTVENHNLKLVKVVKEVYVPSIKEVKSSEFENSDNQQLSLKYDLDSDNKIDNIVFEDFERWGRMYWRIEFGNGKVYEDNETWKRVGILKSKTKGFNDLVVDCDKVLKWNGKKYVGQ